FARRASKEGVPAPACARGSMNPNGVDPYGDWTDCYPDGFTYQDLVAFKPKKKKIGVIQAPRACLKNPKRVRVAVQTYRGYEAPKSERADWAITKRTYTKRIRLR